MLHLETIEPRTFSLLESLMNVSALKILLVGGTALALKYGHRTSIDLDFFYNKKFEHEPIIKDLQNAFGDKFQFEGDKSRWGIFCYIEKIKVDIVYYPHPLLREWNKDIRR